MVFSKTVDTPANTAKTSPLESWMGISRGLLYRMQVMFPSGCVGLVGSKLYEGAHQIYPVTVDEWFVGNNETIDFEDLYFITTLNTKLRILTYNEDDLYDHKVYFRIGLVVQPHFIAHFLPTMVIDNLEKVLQKMDAEKQETLHAAALAGLAQLPKEGS